jgi:tRNA (guanine-N7-)-methyltransferase
MNNPSPCPDHKITDDEINNSKDPSLKREYMLYGRRGRALSHEKQAYIDTLTEKRYGFTVADIPEILSMCSLSSPQKAPAYKALRLEIGFGSGDHLAHQAFVNPDVLFLGVEPFLNGFAGTLEKFAEKNLDNVKVLQGDARVLLDALPDNCLERIYLLYPDPWPKKRHSHRRFVQLKTLESFWRVLAVQGMLHIASDIPEYIRWSLSHLYNQNKFQWLAQSQQDWFTPFENWCGTKYERKALREGRTPYYLSFIKPIENCPK